jgi:hypothetical protein
MNSETGKEDSVYIGGLPVMESADLVESSNTIPFVATGFLAFVAGGLLIWRRKNGRKSGQVIPSVEVSEPLSPVEPKADAVVLKTEKEPALLQPVEAIRIQSPPALVATPFNATEKEVVLLCLLRSEAGGHVDLEEINHVLGIKNKSKGLQKKVRSEVFNSINNKFRALSNTPSGLIESVRNKNDKRYFDYFIEPVHFSAVRQLLDSVMKG